MKQNVKVFKWERLYDFGSITALVTQFSPADNCGVQEVIVRDKNPIRRQGLSDYYLRRYWWYGKLIWAVVIEATWFRVDEYREFANRKDAVAWLCEVLKAKHQPGSAISTQGEGK